MKDHCRRTCDLCLLIPSTGGSTGGSMTWPPNPIVVASKCTDEDKRCPAWAAYANQCQSNRLFMSKMCKKTCGLCSSLQDNSLYDMPAAASAPLSTSHGARLLLLWSNIVLSLLVMKWSEKQKSCNGILLSLYSTSTVLRLVKLQGNWSVCLVTVAKGKLFISLNGLSSCPRAKMLPVKQNVAETQNTFRSVEKDLFFSSFFVEKKWTTFF